MSDVTLKLATNVAESHWRDLPPEVRHEGSRTFLNWLGCALRGAEHPAVDAALAAFGEIAGPPQATVLARGVRMDVANAALLNGLSASAYAFDDTHLESIAHPTAPSAAAMLALAERQRVSGEDFLHAIVLSNEVQCRLACALAVPPAHCHVGFYMTGLTGGVGVAAAVARLLGLDARKTAWAIGTAAAQGGGFRATHATMGSGYVPAHAGRTGLVSALLAAKGFTSSDHILEGRNGFADVYGSPANLAALTDRWGEHFEAMAVPAKPYPAGCFIHPAIDACLQLARSRPIDPESIARIDLRVSKLALGLTGTREPRHGYDAQVSVYHWAAAVFVHRAAGLEQTSDACVADPAVVALRKRVEAAVDPALPPDAAEATLIFRDGTRASLLVEHCLGSKARPMTDAELEDKFTAQVEPVLGRERARRLIGECWSIGKQADVAAAAPGVWGRA